VYFLNAGSRAANCHYKDSKMTAHSELIEKVKYCRRLSPHEFELLQSEIIAALFDTLQISRADAATAIEAMDMRAVELRPYRGWIEPDKHPESYRHIDSVIGHLESAAGNLRKALEAK